MSIIQYTIALCVLAIGCNVTDQANPGKEQSVQRVEVDSMSSAETENQVVLEMVIERNPFIIGGLAAIQDSMTYPADALEAGIEGRVRVRVRVDEHGAPHDATVTHGLCPSCDKEAIRVVEMARFIPGKIIRKGEEIPTSSTISIPVDFAIKQ